MSGAPLIRPTFELELPLERDEAISALRQRLTDAPAYAGRWRAKGRWAELYVPEPERRVWSPYLAIRLTGTPEGCTLFGRFGPHPEVWTFFMFLYVLVAFLVLFGATLGYVQWASDAAAWGLWAVWIGVPMLLLIHTASAVGARLGQAQMARLRGELDELLEAL
jgi:hypothetical protein